MATKHKTGRPCDYLPEMAADICSLLSDGETYAKFVSVPEFLTRRQCSAGWCTMKSFSTNTR